MTDLADFLLARIADDEEVALAAAGWGPTGRERVAGRWHRDGLNSVVDQDRQLVIYGDGPSPGDGHVDHITRWDPARVLIDCEAKRRIVDELRVPSGLDDEDVDLEWAARNGDRAQQVAITTLRLLALPHADHPDYDQAWRL